MCTKIFNRHQINANEKNCGLFLLKAEGAKQIRLDRFCDWWADSNACLKVSFVVFFFHLRFFFLIFFSLIVNEINCMCCSHVSGSFYCQYCLKRFASQNGVSRHQKYSCSVIEPTAPPLKCPYCTYVCRRPDNMKNHVATHHSSTIHDTSKYDSDNFLFGHSLVKSEWIGPIRFISWIFFGSLRNLLYSIKSVKRSNKNHFFFFWVNVHRADQIEYHMSS